MMSGQNKLNEMQMELLKSFVHVTDEKQIAEIKSLLNLYFRNKLEESIEQEESQRGYTAAVYEEWVNSNKK